ncbi:hypothetical protein LTR65_009084 [Meristemomyces frigidus]
MMFQANPFENSVGHFWGIHPTRDYMRARFAHVEGLLKINTFEAVRVALVHLEDMLRLCRGDNMGVRALMPALYLRLGRDQECYDFIKWWFTVSENDHYDWGNMDLPYLDMHGADPFEPVDRCKPFYKLAMLVSLTLLKIRLLLELRSVQNAIAVGGKVPQEILDHVREQMVGPVLANNRDLMKDVMNGRPLAPYITMLKSQISELYDHGKQENEHMWPALLSPGNNLSARPQYTGFGSMAEMQMALRASMTDNSQQVASAETHTGLLLPATPQCAVCKKTDGLSRCASCKVESYCCREHQKSDWQSHRATCNTVRSTRATLDREEHALRVYKGDLFTPANPFRTNAGRFWRIPAAQPYLQARLALVNALLKQNSHEAVEAALLHSREMLDLARFDKINVKRLMPAIYLRLGRDQECYDFIRWWYFAAQDCRNDFEPTTPYLTMTGEDVFEPIVFHLVEHEVIIPDLSHIVALTLVKVRVLLDLRTLQATFENFDSDDEDLVSDFLDKQGSRMFVSAIVAKDPKLRRVVDDVVVPLANMEAQVSKLYAMLVKENEHLLCKFLSPVDRNQKDWLAVDPQGMQCGGCSEAAEVLQSNYKSWVETPGALSLLEELALKDSKSCTAKATRKG